MGLVKLILFRFLNFVCKTCYRIILITILFFLSVNLTLKLLCKWILFKKF